MLTLLAIAILVFDTGITKYGLTLYPDALVLCVAFHKKTKVLFLGAAHFQLPAIRYAMDAGYQIVTCDNRPSNPGHALAHTAYNVSTAAVEDVARVASSEQVDGIVGFASDVAARTASQVCAKLGLPTANPTGIEILTNKRRFREILTNAGLQPITFQTFRIDEAAKMKDFIAQQRSWVVVKPVDSNGSKGVSVARSDQNLDELIARAFRESPSAEVIVEDFIPRLGHQICGDGYIDKGRLSFVQFGDGHFYDVPGFMAPVAETFPSSHSQATLGKLAALIEAILVSSGYTRGVFNVDAVVREDGEPFVIEIGPRSGGNFIPVAIHLNTGVNLVQAAVELALDRDVSACIQRTRSSQFHACYMLHSMRSGILDRIEIEIPGSVGQVIEVTPYARPGDYVLPFTQGNFALGNVLLEFSSLPKMHDVVSPGEQRYFHVILRQAQGSSLV